MEIPINTSVTPSLHPNVLKGLKGYNEATAPSLKKLETVMGELYNSVSKVAAARESARLNEAWTPAMQLLKTAEMADRLQNAGLKKMDAVYHDLETAIGCINAELNKPMQASEGKGTINAEIRSHFKSLGKGAGSALRAAIAAGDTQTTGAVLSAPAYLSGLSDTESGVYLRMVHEQQYPAHAARLGVLNGAINLMNTMPSVVTDAFTKAVGDDWNKVKKIKAANTAAEQSFAMSN